MSWTWQMELAEGTEVTDPPTQPAHANQSDAESWLGETWRELADAGVIQVTLYEDGSKVYGPMPLDAG